MSFRNRRRTRRVSARWARAVALVTLAACGGDAGGGENTPGVKGDTITVAAIMPLSDAVAVIGVPIAAGQQTYFDALNARGGVAGRYKVKLLTQDATYANPSSTVQQYQKVKEDIALVAGVVGTDHVRTLLPLLQEDSIIVIPTTFDAAWVREPRLLPWGIPYQLSAINGLAYFVDNAGAGRNICSMVLANGYGEAGEEGARALAEQSGTRLASAVRFKQDDQDFVAPITQLRNAKCDATLLVSLPGVTGKVLGAAAQLGFATQWIAVSPAWATALAQSPLQDYLEKHLWIVFEGPEWGDTTVTAMRDMLAAKEKYRPEQKPDLYFGAGWVIAAGAHALLEKAVADGDLTRGGLLRAMEGMGTVPYGLVGDYRYGPVSDRQPPTTSTIFRVNATKPVGLEQLVSGYGSPIAAKFAFTRKEQP